MLGFKNFLMEEDEVGVVEMVLIVVAENPLLHYVVHYSGQDTQKLVKVNGSFGRLWRAGGSP